MTRRENLLRTIRRDAPASVPYRYDGCLTVVEPAIVARPRAGGLDDWGANWIASGTDEGSYPDDEPVLSVEQAAELEAPDADWSAITADLHEQVASHAGDDTALTARNEASCLSGQDSCWA